MGSNINKKKRESPRVINTRSLILKTIFVCWVGVVSTATMEEVRTICEASKYTETCEKTLSIGASAGDPKVVLKIAFQAAINELKQASNNVNSLKRPSNRPRIKQALENCQGLLGIAADDLERSVIPLEDAGTKFDDLIEDLEVRLTGAVTFHENCAQEFEIASDASNGGKIGPFLDKSRQLAIIGLDAVHYFSSKTSLKRKKRNLFSSDLTGIPSWVGTERQGLLMGDILADVIVAQDGSGKYRTVNEALKDYPAGLPPNKFFTVYIKAGVYNEYVTILRNMRNVLFIGDGATKTKITGNKNFVDGINTINTATVAITGPYFMAKDIGFENSAGAIKHQAVALRVMADAAVFFNCQMDGYQDTLYTHAYRQFYRDCTITGTIDFVFGDAAAIFQNCNFVVRKPLPSQQCIVTAQGRSIWNGLSGIVIQKSTFSVEKDFVPARDGVSVYLGRPWKEFSRTVIMQSFIGDFISPEGWMRWDGDFAINTCYYAEFGNSGPGSNLASRVTWQGIKKIDAAEALGFTVGRFFQDDFIKASGVPYFIGLPA